MTPRPSARALTSSVSDQVVRDQARILSTQIASRFCGLLAAQLTVSHSEQFAGPGIAGVTSPTGIARRPDDADEFNDSLSL